MKKRIFISTNSTLYGLFNFNIEKHIKLNASNLSLLKNNDKIYYNGKTFDTISTTSSIIVVNDSSTTRLEHINANTDFLLHHTNTNEHIKNVVNNFEGKKVQGEHPGKYYNDVFEIIFDDNNTDKLNSILKVLGFTDDEIKKEDELEAKLELLHECLMPNNVINVNIDKEWNADVEFSALKTAANFANNDPFNETYISALTALRNKLLLQ